MKNSIKHDIPHSLQAVIYCCTQSNACVVSSSVNANTKQFCNPSKIFCVSSTLLVYMCFWLLFFVFISCRYLWFFTVKIILRWKKKVLPFDIVEILHCNRNCKTSIVLVYVILESKPQKKKRNRNGITLLWTIQSIGIESIGIIVHILHKALIKNCA